MKSSLFFGRLNKGILLGQNSARFHQCPAEDVDFKVGQLLALGLRSTEARDVFGDAESSVDGLVTDASVGSSRKKEETTINTTFQGVAKISVGGVGNMSVSCR